MRRLTPRLLTLFGLLMLAACGTNPAALGITGPSPGGKAAGASVVPRPPPPDTEGATEAPGIPGNMGRTYSPSVAPTYGTDGSFFGYN
jgi:hypothetical protein